MILRALNAVEGVRIHTGVTTYTSREVMSPHVSSRPHALSQYLRQHIFREPKTQKVGPVALLSGEKESERKNDGKAKNLLLTGYGMTLGFSTIVIPSVDATLRENTLNSSYNSSQSSFVDPLQLTKEEISWFSSINLIHVPLGRLLSGSLTQPMYLYLYSGSINLIHVPLGRLLSGSLTQPMYLCSGSINLIYVPLGRLLSGSLTQPMYLCSGSINLICVPLGCLLSGSLTQPMYLCSGSINLIYVPLGCLLSASLTQPMYLCSGSINLICVPLGCLLSASLTQPMYLCSGSINLICVPLGCLLSGSLTQPMYLYLCSGSINLICVPLGCLLSASLTQPMYLCSGSINLICVPLGRLLSGSLTQPMYLCLGSINLICVPLGCLLSGSLTQPLGRKRAMMLVNIPFIAAWIMFHYASSVGMLYTSLALTGFGGGLLEAPVLTYVAEITQPHLRGMLSATSSMCVILGVFIQFILGTLLPWRSVAAVNIIFPLTALVALCFVPESPYWLITKKRMLDAEKSLCWLRGWVEPKEVQCEFQNLVASLTPQSEKDSIDKTATKHEQIQVQEPEQEPSNCRCTFQWRNYTKKTFLKPYFIVTCGFFFGHFAGMTTLQTFAVSIFKTLGTPVDEYVATLYLGLVELAGTLVCVILVHWTGKRPLTFVSTIGNGLCFIVVATYAYLLGDDSSPVIAPNAYSWVPLIFLVGSAFLTHVGIRLLPWILIGEVYPTEVRGVASGASGSIGYIFSFVANKVYFYMRDGLTLPGTFWIYGAISLIGSVYFFFELPETEGRTLHEIEEHFAGKRDLMTRKVSRRETKNDDVDKWAAVNPALVAEDVESHL
uniref:Major facilitator superfamily (MFS) profile domain-containing protein n=1 Tax=Timema bartmani TaxID=61472 RepID=A0A7R9EUG0_9NEOP|nr:unnamed protein product [Timema bartmani]